MVLEERRLLGEEASLQRRANDSLVPVLHACDLVGGIPTCREKSWVMPLKTLGRMSKTTW